MNTYSFRDVLLSIQNMPLKTDPLLLERVESAVRMETGSINHAKKVREYVTELMPNRGLRRTTFYTDGTSDVPINTPAIYPAKTFTISVTDPANGKVIGVGEVLTDTQARIEPPKESEADRIMRITREMSRG